MQIKIYTIPVPGGELMEEEMNTFLRSKKVLQMESQLVSNSAGSFWCFCIRYLNDINASDREKAKVDYRQVLDDAAFKRYMQFREIRKKIAQDEAIPAYAVFTDEELAALAKMENLTPSVMKTVKGIGDKKVEKYGQHFTAKTPDEKSQSPA